MKERYFIITVDTEGDNLWAWHKGEPITTNNVKFIPRFQELCNNYGFKPVYLTNYEMLMDDEYCTMVKTWQDRGNCEVGIHLHAWNNPPFYELNAKYNGNPYLIEYPENIMRAKFKVLYDLYVDKIGCKPHSHRAGRWAMNEKYYKILNDFDVFVDCSHTPHVSWKHIMGETMGGSDYSNVLDSPNFINGILEVPVTSRVSHYPLNGTFKHRIKTVLLGEVIQLRPAIYNLKQMKHLVDIVINDSSVNYLEFMLHSSELMPNGSPYFKDIQSIDFEYEALKQLFTYLCDRGYKGVTLAEYSKLF